MTGSYLYIPINPGSKRPIAEFGGWPIDPSEKYVCEIDEIRESEHEWWAIVAHKTSNLLVFDIDLYKMSDDEKSQVDKGWFGILDETRIVKTPSGGIHVYVLTDSSFEDLPREIDHVDLKGDVARGYVLSHPREEYTVVNDESPVEVSSGVLRELPAFQSNTPRGAKKETEPVVSEEEMRLKTSPPCLKKALDATSDFADRLINSVKFGSTDKLPVYRLLNEAQYPEDTNTAAPSWLHKSPSDTGTNFRVDSGGETFRCWRHDVTGNAYHLLGVKHGVFECGDWAHEHVDLSEVRRIARENGFLTDEDVISCETVQKNDLCPFDCGRRHPFDGVVE